MRIKRRKKATRFRGTHTHGRGFKKKARGSGHRGGKGMAGTGKRGDAKKTLILNLYGGDYFGKDKTLRRGRVIKSKEMTLRTIAEKIHLLVKKESAKKTGDSYEINLKGYRIVGNDKLPFKAVIKADSASSGAKESVKESGGEIVFD